MTKVTFAEGTASPVDKTPASVSKKQQKIKIPSLKDSGPRVLAIILPVDTMFSRLVKLNPELQKLVDARDEWRLGMEIGTLLACWCDELEEKKIWPNAFSVLVDHWSQTTSCQSLGLARNSDLENRTTPTMAQIRRIREALNLLPKEEFPLVWCRDEF
ncbi:hypothetical protein D9757_013741 [Collybiopsis confluens]|uniref:Uncharacterized protein n=1 Tax=Collybiopsis confluens TaxID=2823264 RepID=A0A8H5CZY1_9AGAR|nr:hypothetical protein D9757_013741 [Collybiopsis confluens]